MIVVRDRSAIRSISDPQVRALIVLRFEQLGTLDDTSTMLK